MSDTDTDLDHLRTAIVARAAKLGMTAYAIARDAGGPSEESVRRYMAGSQDMKSSSVAAVCWVLGLELRPREKILNQGKDTSRSTSPPQ